MSEREARLAAVYDECAPRVHAYAVRHCGRDAADDVLAETFAIAWRRLDKVPDPAIGWLIVTARNVISGRRRSADRHLKLTQLYAAHTQLTAGFSVPGSDEIVLRRAGLLQALDALSAREREALLLTAWDGLNHSEAAVVAGCTTRAFRARLMRARARLEATLLDAETPAPENERATR